MKALRKEKDRNIFLLRKKTEMDIERELSELKDEEYRSFSGKLVPGKEVLGVRVPDLRRLAKRIVKEDPESGDRFIRSLPHRYLEENHLHAFILSEEKDMNELIRKTEEFLPYVDNWATCDSFTPVVFRKDTSRVPGLIDYWLDSDREYTVRYGIRLMLSRKDFSKENMEAVIRAGKRNDYYVYMAASWYLSMAALENPEDFKKVFLRDKTGDRLYKETIKKILESRQFTDSEKDFYRNLRKGNG